MIRAGKYLTFLLAREEYAIRVPQVREIMGLQPITAVPQTAPDLKGVMNLRGRITPVSDLRIKLGLPDTEYTSRTCIVIVQLENEAGQMGVIVDAVLEVLNLQESDIQDPPAFGQGIALPYLLGMAKVKGKVKILLNIDRVMETVDLQASEPPVERRDHVEF